MSEHLSLERISALLDEPAAQEAAASHLDVCEECRAEYERMSRMRMALSAMTERDPPSGEWDRIEDRLRGTAAVRLREATERGGGARPGVLLSRAFMGWPMRAAAALVLFAAGIMAGLQLTGPLGERVGADARLAASGEEASEGWTVAGTTDVGEPWTDAPGATYQAAVSELRELVAPRWAGVFHPADGEVDPVAAAERLARLDALIGASRQALDESPADPVANDLLFQLVDERNELASQFRESLRLAGFEYR